MSNDNLYTLRAEPDFPYFPRKAKGKEALLSGYNLCYRVLTHIYIIYIIYALASTTCISITTVRAGKMNFFLGAPFSREVSTIHCCLVCVITVGILRRYICKFLKDL